MSAIYGFVSELIRIQFDWLLFDSPLLHPPPTSTFQSPPSMQILADSIGIHGITSLLLQL